MKDTCQRCGKLSGVRHDFCRMCERRFRNLPGSREAFEAERATPGYIPPEGWDAEDVRIPQSDPEEPKLPNLVLENPS